MTGCRVLLISCNSPYISISRTLARKLELNMTDLRNINVFSISKPHIDNDFETIYVPWKGDYLNTSDSMTVELSGKHYGHIFCTDMLIDIVLVAGIKRTNEITVLAKEMRDYEKLCLHRRNIENVLLQQYPVMHVNQMIQLEVSPINVMVTLVVQDFGRSKVNMAILSEETTVVVLPPTNSQVDLLDNQNLHRACVRNLFYLASALYDLRVLPNTNYRCIKHLASHFVIHDNYVAENSNMNLDSRSEAYQHDFSDVDDLICYISPSLLQLATEVSSYRCDFAQQNIDGLVAVVSADICGSDKIMCTLYPNKKVPINHIAVHNKIMMRLKIKSFDRLSIRIIDSAVYPPVQKYEITLRSTYQHSDVNNNHNFIDNNNNNNNNKYGELCNIQQEFIRRFCRSTRYQYLLSSGDIITIPGNSYLRIPTTDYIVNIIDLEMKQTNDNKNIPQYIVTDCSITDSNFVYFLDSIKLDANDNVQSGKRLQSENIERTEGINITATSTYSSNKISNSSGFGDIAKDLTSYLTLAFRNDFIEYKFIHNLDIRLGINVYGRFKCGKTTSLQLLCFYTSKYYPFLSTKFLDCNELLGKPLKVVMEFLEQFICDTVIGPSVLLIDNLDVLIHDSAAGRYLFLHIDRLFRKADKKNKKTYTLNNYNSNSVVPIVHIQVVISSSVPLNFKSLDLYNLNLSINNVSNQTKIDIITQELATIRNFNSNKEEHHRMDLVSEIINIFDGVSAYELKAVLRKFICHTYQSLDIEKKNVSTDEVINCHNSSNKLYRVKLLNLLNDYKNSNDLKCNILSNKLVGVNSARIDIIYSLYLPISLNRIYKNCPAVLMSRGLLLYGPSGCGKTWIAESAGCFYGLEFVPIRGPELLTKYIGSSEKAIRDIFDTAALSGRPTLILFDELDALCPKRGKDNSGVTDRVVNQLLTCIDGVDSGAKNIYIIATTLRPDMIDPALLRPGRIDKHVFVDLPRINERKQILQYTVNNINLGRYNSGDNDNIEATIEKIANDSPKIDLFSVADLKAIVDNAYMLLISENMHYTNPTPLSCLSGHHIWSAYQQINSSLTEKDLACYRNKSTSQHAVAQLISYK